MMRIDPVRARVDLITVLERGATRRNREAAAGALASLGDPTAILAVLVAWRARRILRDSAAATLVALGLPDEETLALLRSDDLTDRTLAIRVVASSLSRSIALAPGLVQAAHDALTHERLELHPDQHGAVLADLARRLPQ